MTNTICQNMSTLPQSSFDLSISISNNCPALSSPIHVFMMKHSLAHLVDYLPYHMSYLVVEGRMPNFENRDINQISSHLGIDSKKLSEQVDTCQKVLGLDLPITVNSKHEVSVDNEIWEQRFDCYKEMLALAFTKAKMNYTSPSSSTNKIKLSQEFMNLYQAIVSLAKLYSNNPETSFFSKSEQKQRVETMSDDLSLEIVNNTMATLSKLQVLVFTLQDEHAEKKLDNKSFENMINVIRNVSKEITASYLNKNATRLNSLLFLAERFFKEDHEN